MRTERASEIISSPDTIEVMYSNTPVWIDSIDEARQTAGIRLLETGNTLEVPIGELRERGKRYSVLGRPTRPEVL